MPAIGRIAIGDLDLDLDRVVANVSARHGRDTVNDGPTAATGNVELIGLTPAEVDAIDVGQSLVVELDDGSPMLVGVVTDAALARAVPGQPARLRLMSTSILSTLGTKRVGRVDWPAEEWSNRAIRILREAGFAEGEGPPAGGGAPVPPLLDDFEALGAGVALGGIWGLTPWIDGTNPAGDGAGNVVAPEWGVCACWVAAIAPAPAIAVAGTFYGLDPTFAVQTDSCIGLGVSGFERWELGPGYGDYWILRYYHADGVTVDPVGVGAAGVPGAALGLMLARDGDKLRVYSFPIGGALADATLLVERIDTHSVGVPLRPYVQPDLTSTGFSVPIGDVWGGAVTVPASRYTPKGTPRAIESDKWVIQPPPSDPRVIARTLDQTGGQHAQELDTSALDALTVLLQATGGCVCDLPDGRILVQALDARAELASIELHPDVVVYSPEWQKVLDIINRQAATYGDADAGVVTAAAPADSFDRYGDREAPSFSTGLANAADAQARVDAIVDRYGYSRWAMPACDVLDRYALAVGQRVFMTEIPESPVKRWTPVVEGWSETFDGLDWHMTLSLSDPALSGIYVPEGPPENTVQPSIVGEPKVDVVLTCNPGEWSNKPTSYGYQWIAGGEWVGVTDSPTLTLTDAEIGLLVHCDVTATNEVGTGAMWTEQVGPVDAGVPPWNNPDLTVVDTFDAVGAGVPLAAPWFKPTTAPALAVGVGDGSVQGGGGARAIAGGIWGGFAIEVVGGVIVMGLQSQYDPERIELVVDLAAQHFSVSAYYSDGNIDATFLQGNSAAIAPSSNGHYGLVLRRNANHYVQAFALDPVTGAMVQLGGTSQWWTWEEQTYGFFAAAGVVYTAWDVAAV